MRPKEHTARGPQFFPPKSALNAPWLHFSRLWAYYATAVLNPHHLARRLLSTSTTSHGKRY